MRNNKLRSRPGKNIARLYKSLYEDFCRFKSDNPDMSDRRVVEEVINMQAPCFGLETRVAGMIICKMERKCRKEKIERLKSRLYSA